MTKAPFQSLVSTGELVGASPFAPLNKVLRIRVPCGLERRRLYLGFLYAAYSGTVGTGKEVSVEVFFGKDGGSLKFDWSNLGLNAPGNPPVPSDGTGIVPPFCVETFTAGSSPQFPSTVPFQTDDMVALGMNSITADTHLVRMAAIPFTSDCDEIVAKFNFDAPSGTTDYFQAWFGIRADA